MDKLTIARNAILQSIAKINTDFIQSASVVNSSTVDNLNILSQCTSLLASAHRELGDDNERKD
jgi:hypothetical protein